jgi:uncharacterized protein (DUF2236 family)
MSRTNLFPTDDEARRLLVGPESVTWRFGSDPRLYFVMLYPLLLQVAHPVVGAGVRDYSDFERRPWARLIQTLDYVTLLIYGGEDAIAMGRRLRAMHKQFRGVREDGERYYALEPDAYAWVHATLIESYVQGHAHFGRPMGPDERERFYAEYRGLGRLVGVRETDLPDTWAGFRGYFDAMLDAELTRTVSVDRVLHSVQNPARPPLPLPDPLWRLARIPARRTLWLGGVGLMAPRLRARLAIAWSPSDERQFRLLAAAARATTPLLPGRARVLGPVQLRMRRRAIARGPLGAGGSQATGTATVVRDQAAVA